MGLRRAMWFVVLGVGVVAPVSAVAAQRFLALGQSQFAGNLKVAHCANTFCTPYLRRR